MLHSRTHFFTHSLTRSLDHPPTVNSLPPLFFRMKVDGHKFRFAVPRGAVPGSQISVNLGPPKQPRGHTQGQQQGHQQGHQQQDVAANIGSSPSPSPSPSGGVTGGGSGGGSGGGAPSGVSAAAQQLAEMGFSKEAQQLADMGFTAEAVAEALHANENDAGRALNALLG